MQEYKVIIDRWVDGDTVDVDIDLGFDVILKKQRVRLHGIDAWESRTRDLEEKEKGLTKSSVRTSVKKVNLAFLKQRLMMQVVSMVESLERFGLLVIEFGDKSLNEYLVEKGRKRVFRRKEIKYNESERTW